MKSETPVRALVQKGATVSALGLGCMGTSEFYGVRRMGRFDDLTAATRE